MIGTYGIYLPTPLTGFTYLRLYLRLPYLLGWLGWLLLPFLLNLFFFFLFFFPSFLLFLFVFPFLRPSNKTEHAGMQAEKKISIH